MWAIYLLFLPLVSSKGLNGINLKVAGYHVRIEQIRETWKSSASMAYNNKTCNI